MPFTAVLALLGALAPGSAAAAASKTASVANGAVTATINAAGCTLLSVTTEGGELQFRIEQDNVAFEIAPLPPHPDAENVASPPPPSDVLYFSNLTLARLVPSASGTMVTCIFNEHSLPGTGGVIVVPSLVYEAREGWNFISRRATLMPAPPAQHGRSTNTTGVMIKIVTPFSGSIAPALAAAAPAPAASASAAASGTTTRNPPTITPASPVFSQAAGGVFIRSADTGSDDGSKGLMVVVQNNFIRDSSSSSSSPALRAASAVNLAYQADVRHNFATSTSGDHGGKGGDASSVARSAFQADLVLFAPYAERGAAAASVPYSPSGLTAAEYRRFWSAAEAFLLTPPSSRVGTTKMSGTQCFPLLLFLKNYISCLLFTSSCFSLSFSITQLTLAAVRGARSMLTCSHPWCDVHHRSFLQACSLDCKLPRRSRYRTLLLSTLYIPEME